VKVPDLAYDLSKFPSVMRKNAHRPVARPQASPACCSWTLEGCLDAFSAPRHQPPAGP